MVLCLGEPPRKFLLLLYLHFIFDLHLILLLYLHFVDFLHSHLLFDIIPHPFVDYPPGFYTHFILSAQPIAE